MKHQPLRSNDFQIMNYYHLHSIKPLMRNSLSFKTLVCTEWFQQRGSFVLRIDINVVIIVACTFYL